MSNKRKTDSGEDEASSHSTKFIKLDKPSKEIDKKEETTKELVDASSHPTEISESDKFCEEIVKKEATNKELVDAVSVEPIEICSSDFERFKKLSGNLLQSAKCSDTNLMDKVRLSYWQYLKHMKYLPERTSIESFAHFASKNGYREIFAGFDKNWKLYLQKLKQKKRAAAIIYDPTLVYVLVVRGFGKDQDYVLPGGRLEDNEKAEEALMRELFEELGTKEVIINQTVRSFTDVISGTTVFPCYPVDLNTSFGPTVDAEIKEIVWMK